MFRLSQKALNRALDDVLQRARRISNRRLHDNDRYIIFSDHHKGTRNAADDFQPCEPAYLAALDYYLEAGHTLIVLGDAEELWEEKAKDVIDAYEDVLRSEQRFYEADRYIRIYGNHDDNWRSERQVKKYLHRFFPNIKCQDGLLFHYSDDGGVTGEIFLTHGHQGTLDSDSLAWFSRLCLPLYRQFQIWTGLGRTTPAKDACLRADHDTKMYLWTGEHKQLILIAGHTHRPIWSSKTHLEKLLSQLYVLTQVEAGMREPDYDEKVAGLKAEIKRREEKYPPCTDTIKTRPSYFNTGCCRFEDGDITGIEIDKGVLRLVKWGNKDGKLARSTLEESPLKELFSFL